MVVAGVEGQPFSRRALAAAMPATGPARGLARCVLRPSEPRLALGRLVSYMSLDNPRAPDASRRVERRTGGAAAPYGSARRRIRRVRNDAFDASATYSTAAPHTGDAHRFAASLGLPRLSSRRVRIAAAKPCPRTRTPSQKRPHETATPSSSSPATSAGRRGCCTTLCHWPRRAGP